jgi:hypothetical protein
MPESNETWEERKISRRLSPEIHVLLNESTEQEYAPAIREASRLACVQQHTACVLYTTKRFQLCEVCLSVKTPVACQRCNIVRYCSAECKRVDRKPHAAECTRLSQPDQSAVLLTRYFADYTLPVTPLRSVVVTMSHVATQVLTKHRAAVDAGCESRELTELDEPDANIRELANFLARFVASTCHVPLVVSLVLADSGGAVHFVPRLVASCECAPP